MFKHRADYYFWAAALLILIKGIIEHFASEDDTLAIDIGDTYYVADSLQVTIFNTLVFAFIGFIYRILYNVNAGLNKKLTKLHTKGSINSILFYWIAMLLLILFDKQPSILSVNHWYTDTNFILMLCILLFVVLQPLLIVNMIIGLTKREKQL